MEFLKQWRFAYKKDYWTMRQTCSGRILEPDEQSILKYKTVKIPGCGRPVLLLLDRNCVEDSSSLKKTTGIETPPCMSMSYAGQMEYELGDRRRNVFHNYTQI